MPTAYTLIKLTSPEKQGDVVKKLQKLSKKHGMGIAQIVPIDPTKFVSAEGMDSESPEIIVTVTQDKQDDITATITKIRSLDGIKTTKTLPVATL
ncbi:MAG: hypothetical protein ABH829_02775 [archaeon]